MFVSNNYCTSRLSHSLKGRCPEIFYLCCMPSCLPAHMQDVLMQAYICTFYAPILLRNGHLCECTTYRHSCLAVFLHSSYLEFLLARMSTKIPIWLHAGFRAWLLPYIHALMKNKLIIRRGPRRLRFLKFIEWTSFLLTSPCYFHFFLNFYFWLLLQPPRPASIYHFP